jgi:hypothetical protein
MDLEITRTCKSGALTPTGGKSSSLKESNSSMLSTTRYLTLKEAKTMKELPSLFMITEEPKTRSGMLSILTRQRRRTSRKSEKTSDSQLTSHSTSDQECCSRELLDLITTTLT